MIHISRTNGFILGHLDNHLVSKPKFVEHVSACVASVNMSWDAKRTKLKDSNVDLAMQFWISDFGYL